jgi:hypothetical protein
MKQNTFLTAMSIVLIVCSALGILQVLFFFLISVAVSRTGTVEYEIMLFLLCSIARILCSILEIIAGIKGIIASSSLYKTASCIKLGIGILVLKLIVGLLFSFAVAHDVIVLPLVILSSVFPTLYICSARWKSSIDAPRL